MGINCIDVIDKREDKSKIGRVFKGMLSKKRDANVLGDLSNYLKQRLIVILEKGENNTDLVFIIHELKISEQKSDMGKTGSCKLEIEFATKKDSSLYSLGIFNASIVEGALDVNGTHGRRIIKVIKKCLKAFNKTKDHKKKIYPLDIEDPKYIFNYDSIPPKGAYVSFGDMARKRSLDQIYFKMSLSDFSKSKKYYCNFNWNGLGSVVGYLSDGTDMYMNVLSNKKKLPLL